MAALSSARRALLAPALLTAYLCWPVSGWGIFGGGPLGPAGGLALVLLWVSWAFNGRPRSWALAALLLALKIGGGTLVLDRGLRASYFANEERRPPVEPNIDHPRESFTRIDPRLEFTPGVRDVPLFFVNDLRFNFYRAGDPDREALPYSVAWDGFLRVDDDQTLRVYLRSPGSAQGAITIDGFPVVALAPGDVRAVGSVSLRSGLRRLHVELSAPRGQGREVSAGLLDAADVEQPFGESVVLAERVSWRRVLIDRALRPVSYACDVLLIVWLAWAAAHIASVTHACALLALVEAWLFARPWATQLMVLPGGSDSLTYETYARDILLHGPLMTLGEPLGRGGPFYYQPLYPYVLAGLHRIFGAPFFGIVFFQRLLVPATLALVWQTTRRLFGDWTGRVAVLVGGLFLYLRVGPWAALIYGEIVFIPLACAWAYCAVRLTEDSDMRLAVLAGLAGGLATLSRSTLLLAWPLVFTLVAAGRWGRTRVLQPLAVMALVMCAVVGLATMRNWIVSRELVPIATSFGVNFYMGNQPPPALEGAVALREASLRGSVHDEFTRKVAAFALEAPATFATHLWNKALFTLGFYGALVPTRRTAGDLVLVWLVAAAGAIIVVLRRAGGGAGWAAQAMPGAIAFSHFMAGVIVFPFDERLILPFYVLVLPYAAVAVARLRRWPS